MTKSFEEQLAELEKVVEQLERGDLSLEDNVRLFERGTKLSEACKTQLDEAESRIEVLMNPEKGAVRTEELEVVDGEDEIDEEDEEE